MCEAEPALVRSPGSSCAGCDAVCMLGVVPACDATFTTHMLHVRVAGEVGISILATVK